MTIEHLDQLKTVLQMIKPTSLQRVAFYDAYLALERFAPTIFDIFPNLSEFTVAFTSDNLFTRQTKAKKFLKKSSAKYALNHLWLQLRDGGFGTSTNHRIAKKLIKDSPHLTQLFVESMATTAHEDIIGMLSTGRCPNLEVLGMTHYGRIRQLLAHPIVKEIKNRNKENNSSLKKTAQQPTRRGIRVLAITEDHIHRSYFGYMKIKENMVKEVHNTLELLYLENLNTSSHVTWPELFSCCTKDIWFPRLRHLILHLGSTFPTTSYIYPNIIEEDFQGKLCTVLSRVPGLENFTYRRELVPRYYREEKTLITDSVLQTLIEYCPVLTTFRVAGCYRFTTNKLRQFIQEFEGQLKTVEFDCSIGGENLQFVVKTIKHLEKISVRHICQQERDFHSCPNMQEIEAKNILLTWGGSFDITTLEPIDGVLHDIF